MRIKNKKNLELKFSDGFTLIEVMAAVAVLSIGLIGGLTVITKNLSIISGGEDRIIAANLAAEGIELVRNVRDTNWLKGAAWDAGFNIPAVGDRKRIKFFCGGLQNNTTGGVACGGGSCNVYTYKIGSDVVCYSDNYGANVTIGATVYVNGVSFKDMKRLITVERISADSIKVTFRVWSSSIDITAEETLYNWK